MDVALARSPRSFAQVWVKRAIDTLASRRVFFARPSQERARCQHRNEQALESSPVERSEKRSSVSSRAVRRNSTPDRPGSVLPSSRSEEHTSELQSRRDLVCRLLLEKKKDKPRSKTQVAHI